MSYSLKNLDNTMDKIIDLAIHSHEVLNKVDSDKEFWKVAREREKSKARKDVIKAVQNRLISKKLQLDEIQLKAIPHKQP